MIFKQFFNWFSWKQLPRTKGTHRRLGDGTQIKHVIHYSSESCSLHDTPREIIAVSPARRLINIFQAVLRKVVPTSLLRVITEKSSPQPVKVYNRNGNPGSFGGKKTGNSL